MADNDIRDWVTKVCCLPVTLTKQQWEKFTLQEVAALPTADAEEGQALSAWIEVTIGPDESEGDPPVPGLTPDMLSEEDRDFLSTLRCQASQMASKYEVENSLNPHPSMRAFADHLWQAVAWADRLIADNHGEQP